MMKNAAVQRVYSKVRHVGGRNLGNLAERLHPHGRERVLSVPGKRNPDAEPSANSGSLLTDEFDLRNLLAESNCFPRRDSL
jgi:hypothetical protein